ncbi:sensor histidine kinase [Pedobacter nanyangensis]|uniref:sensor histidine kinase n=1 Tax=Pedobacter nanyangensis TaxID=1562389 RepID=UPI000DE29DC4|nr:HAMP domain-containing sensor histidine kinase [Pedobacter nanyangensis]
MKRSFVFLDMNKKLSATLLFTASFLVLIGLQGYYLYNSYRFEEKELNKYAKSIADSVLSDLRQFEDEASEEALIKKLKRLDSNDNLRNQQINQLKQWYTFKKHFQQNIDKFIEKRTKNTVYDIALRSEIYSIYDENERRELVPVKSPLILFKTKKNIKKGIVFNVGKWNSNLTEKDTELKLNQNYHYTIKSRTIVELLNLRLLVLKHILPLLLVSISIVALLIYLFWKTLKNLRLQQEKVAQLYTSIDSIAHELNTPLTTLKFTLANTPHSETKSLLERQVQRLEKVISSINSNTSESAVASQSDIANYLNVLKAQFDLLQLNTQFNFTYNHALSLRDLEQIIGNLIENSAKYRAINVNLSLDFAEQIYLEVSDDGIGIPQEAQAHIFEKYYRVSRKENLQINGLGLGLYIVKQTIEKHKGNIKVFSNAKNGVTFKITLANGH